MARNFFWSSVLSWVPFLLLNHDKVWRLWLPPLRASFTYSLTTCRLLVILSRLSPQNNLSELQWRLSEVFFVCFEIVGIEPWPCWTVILAFCIYILFLNRGLWNRPGWWWSWDPPGLACGTVEITGVCHLAIFIWSSLVNGQIDFNIDAQWWNYRYKNEYNARCSCTSYLQPRCHLGAEYLFFSPFFS